MYYVYVLKSLKTNKNYIGYTRDLDRRIPEHNRRKYRGQYTSNSGPWDLVFSESFLSKNEAMQKEKFLKTGIGRRYIKSKIKDGA